jgi:beta-galactosidase/beta-glucuronidase
MKIVLGVAVAMVVMCAYRMAWGADWKPASSPLMTRWAKDVSPTNARPEYPRPQMVREQWMNLNGLWDFTPAGGEARKILVPFPMESALSGIGKHYDKSTYRRTFVIPSEWKGQRVLLHFGAVDFETTVSLNGKELGKHTGGYDAFSFDITESLKGDGEQELTVAVTDVTAETQARGKQTTKPEGIWYTPCSGIWQTVWLEPVPKTYIKSVLLEPDLEQRCVWITADVVGDAVEVKAETSLPVDATSQPVSQQVTFKPGERTRLPVTGKGASLRPWSPDDPYLYGLKITAGTDAVETYVGMRHIEVAS